MPRIFTRRLLWLALTMVVLLGVFIWVRVGFPIYQQHAERRAISPKLVELEWNRTAQRMAELDRQRVVIREIRERNGDVSFRRPRRDTEERLEDIVDRIDFRPSEASFRKRWVGTFSIMDGFFATGLCADDATLIWVAELPDLRRLSVEYTNVGDEGVKHIAGLVNLEILYLSGTDVTDASVPVLSGFAKLKFIRLDATCVTEDGITKLRAALPRCEVVARNMRRKQ